MIRHADPDYAIDGLTEKGKREAQLLAHRLVREDVTAFYCSTLGRARCTLAPTLEALGREAEYCEWLREFNVARVKLPYLDVEKNCWDLLPSCVEAHPELYLPSGWREADFIRASDVAKTYDGVCLAFDALLARHGYERDGLSYLARRPSHDTLVLLCHFGVEAVLLSHLLNCSPYSLWQNTVALPSSVTTVYTEEREAGRASFRVSSFADLSHLYVAKEEPAFAARFCECYTDDTRH